MMQFLHSLSRFTEFITLSVDIKTVQKIARLSRIKVDNDRLEALGDELNTILGFVEQLDEVNVTHVAPMRSVMPMNLRQREDKVTTGDYADKIVANAPLQEDDFFMVPKVVE